MIKCPKCRSRNILGLWYDETYDGDIVRIWENPNSPTSLGEVNYYLLFECNECGFTWEGEMKMEKTVVAKNFISAKTAFKIVQTIEKYNCKCEFTRFDKTISANSILMIMSFWIQCKDKITVKCDNEECLNEVCKILEGGYEND